MKVSVAIVPIFIVVRGVSVSIRIPAVKLSPKLVFGMLDIIDRWRDSPERMKEEIVKYYRSESIREKVPTPKNIVRAVTFPSLRHLDLVEGFWPKVSINPNGKTVLNAFHKQGSPEAKRKLGVILYRIDEKADSVIKYLLDLAVRHDIVQFSHIESLLEEEFDVKTEKETRILNDRLKRWLQYLEYVEFIEQEGQMIKVNKAIIDHCAKGKKAETSTQQFTELLIRKYKELVREEGSVYVPIPKLRDAVCEETGLLKDEFYDMLRSTKFTTETYSIMLSEPMLREKGGITVGNKYYYYISIYERG